MTLTSEATAAHTAAKAAVDAAALLVARAARLAATDAVKAVLTRPNGTSMTLGEARLTVKHDDMDTGLVVWGDPDGLLLGAQRDVDVWRVLLVRETAGEYERASSWLLSLADLGAALAAFR